LSAFVWLRWRLLANQMRKGGTANAVIAGIVAVLACIFALLLFCGLFLAGMFLFTTAPAVALLFTWDVIIFMFIVGWIAGLLAELQRSEVLSIEKFLHLPVSVSGVFLINYLSSLASLTLLIFLPAMLGLALGLVFSKGPAMLLLLPLLAAFLFMVTALTYQFQGWLASLMVNKRKGRTVLAMVTIGFVLLFQIPNLINIIRPWKPDKTDELQAKRNQAKELMDRQEKEGKLSHAEAQQRLKKIEEDEALKRKIADEQTWEYVQHVARIVNLVVPLGWLPLGSEGAAAGRGLPALLGMLGMTLIGAASLWRSYRTILRLYTGQFTSRSRPPAPAVAAPIPGSAKPQAAPALFFEKKLPWLSEQASAVALASLRSLLRAPESKLMLMGPFIGVLVLGGILLGRGIAVPEAARPLIGIAAMGLILVMLLQMVGNQFAFDRGGFRVYVLCGAPRKDILLGKNVSTAPIILGLALLVVCVVQAITPMRFDLFLAFIPQAISTYLLYCLLANVLSILSPIYIAPGSLRAKNVKLIPVLLNFAVFLLMPVILGPAMLPYGIEFLVEKLADVKGLPICLFLSLIEVGLVALLYHFVVQWEGVYLQYREKQILDTVTSKTD
jgi:hypothetical protein